MGSYLEYRCARCSFTARVGGPEEFFLAPDGSRQVYGHPDPVSPEAAARGVDGFRMHLWCDGCTAIKQMVTMEFETPCDGLDAWSGRGIARPGFPADAASCLDCGSELLDELPRMPRPCPSCGAAPLECTKLAE